MPNNKTSNCQNCGKELNTQRKYCNQDCMREKKRNNDEKERQSRTTTVTLDKNLNTKTEIPELIDVLKKSFSCGVLNKTDQYYYEKTLQNFSDYLSDNNLDKKEAKDFSKLLVKWFDKVEDNNDKFFALNLIDFSERVLAYQSKTMPNRKIIEIDGEIDKKLRLKLLEDLDNFKFKTKNHFKDKNAIIKIPDGCEISKVFEEGNLDKKEIFVELCGISEEQDFMKAHKISGNTDNSSSFKVKASIYTVNNEAFSSPEEVEAFSEQQIHGFYADIPINWIQSIENEDNKLEQANLCSFSKKEDDADIKNFIDKKFNSKEKSKARNKIKP